MLSYFDAGKRKKAPGPSRVRPLWPKLTQAPMESRGLRPPRRWANDTAVPAVDRLAPHRLNDPAMWRGLRFQGEHGTRMRISLSLTITSSGESAYTICSISRSSRDRSAFTASIGAAHSGMRKSYVLKHQLAITHVVSVCASKQNPSLSVFVNHKVSLPVPDREHAIACVLNVN